MKKQYFVRFRADNSLARECQMIETDDTRRVRDIAWIAAKAWGIRNKADFVDFDIEWKPGYVERASIRIERPAAPQPTLTIDLDDRHKFWAVLDALQAYIDNNNDFRTNTDLAHMTDEEVRDFEAKQSAAVGIVDKLEDVLTAMAEA